MITLERYNYGGSATNTNACIIDSDNRTVTFNMQNNTTDRFIISIYLSKIFVPFVFEFEVLSVSNSSSCLERVDCEFAKVSNNGVKKLGIGAIDLNLKMEFI